VNRKEKRAEAVLAKHPMRTDGLPKNGYSWAQYRTRKKKYARG
jgi:hypothetical protein